MLIEAAVLLLAVLGLLFVAATWHFDHWRKKGVPYVRPSPFTGNMGKVLAGKDHFHQAFTDAYYAFPDAKVVGLWTFRSPVLLIRDLELAKRILVKDFGSFPHRSFRPDEQLEPQTARMMFALQDADVWRTVRSKLTPVFTSGKMKLMYPLMDECCQELVDVIDKENQECDGERTVLVSDLTSRLTIDVITSCAFGCVGKALADATNSVLYKIFDGILHFKPSQGLGFVVMYFGPRWMYKVMCWLGCGVFDKEKLDQTSCLVKAELEQRDVHGKTRADMFGLTVQLRDAEREAGVPRDQSVFEGHYFTAVSLQFLIAGTETSSATINYALHELAMHSDLQTRSRDHIRDTINKHGGKLSYEAVHAMDFLDMVLNEVMRLYPILPYLDRICNAEESYRIPGTDTVIEKGIKVFIPIYAIQHDPKYFPDPELFDPDRWRPENSHRMTKDAFMAFGVGPRYCIGNRFAMVSMKLALCHILLKYEVEPSSSSLRDGLVFNRRSFTLNLKHGLRLRMNPVH